MGSKLPRIASVAVVAPGTLQVVWREGGDALIDLTEWIEAGEDLLASLAQPSVFAGAEVGEHGAFVTWDGGEGDLAIDAAHLELIAARSPRSAGIAA